MRVRVLVWLGVLIAGLMAFYWLVTPSLAHGRVHLEGGEAVWFFRSCAEFETKDVGEWQVEPGVERTLVLMEIENAYPGYRLYCEVHLANSGELPFQVSAVQVENPNPSAVAVTARLDPSAEGKTLQPCGFVPAWGTRPSRVSTFCRAEIQVDVRLLPGAAQHKAYGFLVMVNLMQR